MARLRWVQAMLREWAAWIDGFGGVRSPDLRGLPRGGFSSRICRRTRFRYVGHSVQLTVWIRSISPFWLWFTSKGRAEI